LFSKILAQNADVWGWADLLNEYWIGHDREPFSKYWENPDLLSGFDWTQSNIFVTSISCPYALNGEYVEPKYKEFIECAKKFAEVQIVIIGRDKNIIELQQQRVRGNITLHKFKKYLDLLLEFNPIFVSQENLYLYGKNYINWLEIQLGLNITQDTNLLDQILSADANKKYIQPVEDHWLDTVTKKASSKWR